MRRALAAALAVGLFATGCARKRLGPDVVEDEPAWSTQEGRERVRLDIATSMIDAGTPESALQLIGDIRKEGDKSLELDLVQARALRELGLYEDAGRLLEAAVQRHPRDAEVRMQLGILRVDQGNIPSALEHFQAAARLDDENAEVWNNLGFALLAAGRPEEAVDALRTSLQLDSSREKTRNNLGFALVASGRVDEAWRVFRAAQGPAAAHYNVGVGLELRGASDEARIRYRKALEEQPGFRAARDALDRLVAHPPIPPERP